MSGNPFQDAPDLGNRVQAALDGTGQRHVLNELSAYVNGLHARIAGLNAQLQALNPPAQRVVSSGFATANRTTNIPPDPIKYETAQEEPPQKKRKLPAASNGSANASTGGWRTGTPVLIARDVAFSVPFRKKLCLEVIGGRDGGLRCVVQGTGGEIEGGMAWSDIDQIIAVPLPEKAQPVTNFVAVPKPSANADSLVWSVPTNSVPKNWLHGSADGSTRPVEESCRDTLEGVLDRELYRLGGGTRVQTPSADEFVSAVVQSHRKGERNWHVKAHLGSKEGFLYPLPQGLLFGFKKPVLYFPFAQIASVSYTSVLQRTFNLVVSTQDSDGSGSDKDFEFAMLDQADFAPLDAWVKKHGLQDASLAAGRRAQPTGKGAQRGGAGGAADGGADGEDGEPEESELAKAERELQDAEDEEEEDFDPGSEGESDGSGEDSEEDDGGGGEEPEAEYSDEDE